MCNSKVVHKSKFCTLQNAPRRPDIYWSCVEFLCEDRRPCFEFCSWIFFASLIFFKVKGQHTFTSVLDAVNICMYLGVSEMFCLLLMPLRMGRRSWFLEDPLVQAQSPLTVPYYGDIQTSRPECKSWRRRWVCTWKCPQCSSGSQPGLWGQQKH